MGKRKHITLGNEVEGIVERDSHTFFDITLFYLKRCLVVTIWYFIPCHFCLCQGTLTAPLEGDQSPAGSLADAQGFEFTFPSMGTLIHLVAYSDDAARVESAFLAAQKKVADLEAILTDYEASSEARQLPSLAARQATAVSDTLWEVIDAADHWHHRSQGALDCSLGALTQLWRKHRRVDRIPEMSLVHQALQDVGWHNVQLDRSARTVTMRHNRIRLDFGSIGKGYVIDQVFELLCRCGLDSSLVNISGDIRCGNPPPGRDGWRVAVAALSRDNEPIYKLLLKNVAVATSGDLWQYQIIDGQKRSHILDPSTGMGILGPTAVTVVAPLAIDADALATAGCVMDWQPFQELIELQSDTHALKMVQRQGKIQREQTSGFPVLELISDEPPETRAEKQ
jgi:FAD:protein FMN transferase